MPTPPPAPPTGPSEAPPPPPAPAPTVPKHAGAPPFPPGHDPFIRPAETSRIRLGPNLNVLVVGINANAADPLPIGAPSIRAGVRFATLERSALEYSANLGVALQFGVEGHRVTGGFAWGFGFTAKAGLNAVSSGGLFFPFVDLYGFGTVSILRGAPGTVAAGRFGLGLNFNAFAVRPGAGFDKLFVGAGSGRFEVFLLVLALVLPNVELAYTAPSPLGPGYVELRLGLGI